MLKKGCSEQLMKKSVFSRWFFSYCLVLLLPFVLSLCIYSYSGDIIKNKYISNNRVLQEQLSELMEQNINSVESLRNQLIEDSAIISFMNSNGQSASQRYNLVELRNEFSVLSLVNSKIDKLYVYFNNSEKYLNESSFYDAETMFEHAHKDTVFPIEEWENLHNSWQDNQVYYLRNSSGKMQILFVNSMPHYRIYRTRATLYIATTPEKLFGSLNELPFEGTTYFAILNENNEVILANDQFGYDQLDAKHLTQTETNFEQIINGEKYFISCLQLNKYGWKSVILLSEESIQQSARPIRSFTFFASVICMLADFMLAHMLTKRHYKPLKNIVDTLTDNNWQSENEYQEIQRQVASLIRNRQELTAVMDRYQKKLRDEFLSSLLHGKLSGELPDHELLARDYGIICDKEQFYLVLVCADKDIVIQEEKEYHIYQVSLTGMQVLLINADKTVTKEKIVQSIKTKFSQNTVVISMAYYSFEESSAVFHNALLMLEGKVANEHKGVFEMKEIPEHTPSLYEYPPMMEKALSRAVHSGNVKKAQEVIADIVALNQREKYLSRTIMHALIQQVFATLIETAKPLSDDQAVQAEDILRHLMHTDSVTEMLNTLNDYVVSLSQTTEKNDTIENTPKLLANILNCVHAHYTEADFNVSALAEMLDMNNSYLSNYFKEQMGVGILNYITNLRMQKAKTLLKEQPEITLNNVILLAGFSNVNSFVRTFKKQEGVTPSEFKKEMEE